MDKCHLLSMQRLNVIQCQMALGWLILIRLSRQVGSALDRKMVGKATKKKKKKKTSLHQIIKSANKDLCLIFFLLHLAQQLHVTVWQSVIPKVKYSKTQCGIKKWRELIRKAIIEPSKIIYISTTTSAVSFSYYL